MSDFFPRGLLNEKKLFLRQGWWWAGRRRRRRRCWLRTKIRLFSDRPSDDSSTWDEKFVRTNYFDLRKFWSKKWLGPSKNVFCYDFQNFPCFAPRVGFFFLPPNAAAGIRTHLSRVAPAPVFGTTELPQLLQSICCGIKILRTSIIRTSLLLNLRRRDLSPHKWAGGTMV